MGKAHLLELNFIFSSERQIRFQKTYSWRKSLPGRSSSPGKYAEVQGVERERLERWVRARGV